MNIIMNSFRRSSWFQAVILVAIFPSLVLFPQAVRSNPSGAQVAHGAIEINDLDPGNLKIHQGSNKAIINWESFSIAAGESTQFIQPGANSIALNRVNAGGGLSSIYGSLSANGGLILVNPNGIMVGAGGVVDIGGLAILSTQGISDSNFLSGGPLRFKGNSVAGVTNLGNITSRGGDVVLLGNMVLNKGTVGAPDGTVAMGAGGEFIVDTMGDARLSVVSGSSGGNVGVDNQGTVTANAVEFKAHGNVYALAISNSGIVRANGVNRSGGRITLSAAGNGNVGGKIENTGTLRARNVDGSGGTIMIDGGPGGEVDIISGRVDADGDGDAVGGMITVLGETIAVGANAQVTANGGDGGTIQVGSLDGTESVTIDGKVSADGSSGNGGTVNVLGTESSVISINGEVSANGANAGGTINVSGGTVNAPLGSVISADGGNIGGTIGVVGANSVNVAGAISANGGVIDGGSITLNSDEVNVASTAVMSANGATSGGDINVGSFETSTIDGVISANGGSGDGGNVNVTGLNVALGAASAISADGNAGGMIRIDGIVNTNANGSLSAQGKDGQLGRGGSGGGIVVTGARVNVGATADIDASGAGGGGTVLIGGGFQGKNENVRNSVSTIVNDGASIAVNSNSYGNAGTAVLWSDGSTFFNGDISAQAFGATGTGGFVEVSGKRDLMFRGGVNVNAKSLKNGTLLLDPGPVIIGNGGAATITLPILNGLLQGGTSVIIATEDDDITLEGQQVGGDSTGGGGDVDGDGIIDHNDIDSNAIQWTNSLASLGLFAGGDVNLFTHVRTSGAGSINVIAGWTGLEVDLPTAGFPAGTPGTQSFLNGAGVPSVEDIWEGEVEAGHFGGAGEGRGIVFVGSPSVDSSFEVGSRYGNTNVAGDTLVVITNQVNGGESHHSMLGFRDTGSVFAPRFNNTDARRDLDLNNRGVLTSTFTDDAAHEGLPGNPGGSPPNIATGNPVAAGVLGAAPVDMNGDGVPDGEHLIDSSGIRTDTFVPYNTHQHSARVGNWWWQQFGGDTRYGGIGSDPLGLGDLAPEHGAGGRLKTASIITGGVVGGLIDPSLGLDVDRTGDSRADINVALTGSLLMRGGGREHNYAQIGHGGGANAWADDKTLRNGGVEQGQTLRFWSYNGASNDRVAHSIARLFPIIGDINILTGVDPTTVAYDQNTAVNVETLTGVTDNTRGLIDMEAWQDLRAANAGAVRLATPLTPAATSTEALRVAAAAYATINDSQVNNNSQSYVQIGHLGVGQAGTVLGDINISAGGDINLKSGAHTRNHATIGHTYNGYSYWNTTDNDQAQIRFFFDADAFDNPNLRRGELFGFAGAAHNIMDFAAMNPAQTNLNVEEIAFTPRNPAADGSATAISNGDVVVEALDGSTSKNIVGNIKVDSYGSKGITIQAYEVPDLRDNIPDGTDTDGDGTPYTAFIVGVSSGTPLPYDLDGDGTIDGSFEDIDGAGGGPDGFPDPDNDPDNDGIPNFGNSTNANNGNGNSEADGVESVFDRNFAGIGHGGSNFNTWAEEAGFVTNRSDRNREIVQWRYPNTNGVTGAADRESDSFSASVIFQTPPTGTGEVGGGIDRSVNFLNIFGDVEVNAHNGGVSLKAGNQQIAHAYIGNVGGLYTADMETSNMIIGDVTVTGAGDLLLQGGGEVPFTGRSSVQVRSFAMIGNGGYLTGHQFLAGDINVDFGGDINLISGAYANSFAKIGHGGHAQWGQVGGSFVRQENFYFDNVSTDIMATFDHTTGVATLAYSPGDGVGAGLTNPVFMTGPDLTFTYQASAASVSKSDIYVNAGGNILMDHLPNGDQDTWNLLLQVNGNAMPLEGAYTQIGHGGRDTDARSAGVVTVDYDDKVGDIYVSAGSFEQALDPLTQAPLFDINNMPIYVLDANGDPLVVAGTGTIDMRSGQGHEYWTAIGHRGSDGTDRVGGGGADPFSGRTAALNTAGIREINDDAMFLVGTINVDAKTDIILDTSWAPEITPLADVQKNAFFAPNGQAETAEIRNTGNNVDINDLEPYGYFQDNRPENNGVVIGHGVIEDGFDVITVDSDWSSATGAAGASKAELNIYGHTTVNGIDNVQADINVMAGRDIFVGYVGDRIARADRIGTDQYADLIAGQGGYHGSATQWDETTGEITQLGFGSGFHGGHAQIGHGAADISGNDIYRSINVDVGGAIHKPTGHSGDIMVEAGRDLWLIANENVFVPGTGPDPERDTGPGNSAVPVEGGLAVIGNGGYGMRSPTGGDIDVFVGRDLNMIAQIRRNAEINFAAMEQSDNDENVAAGLFAVPLKTTTAVGATALPAAGDTIQFRGHTTTYIVASVAGSIVTLTTALTAIVDDNEEMRVITEATPGTTLGERWLANAPGTQTLGRFVDHNSNENAWDSSSNSGMAQIGNFSIESSFVGGITESAHEGDINVVVGNDLTMQGGQIESGDYFHEPLQMAFAEIGLGAIGVDGRNRNILDQGNQVDVALGDLTVLVGNNLTMIDGSARKGSAAVVALQTANQAITTTGNSYLGIEVRPGFDTNMNNFVQIGHGEWWRDGRGAGIRDQRIGHARGDIMVLVGNNGDFSGGSVGHGQQDTGGGGVGTADTAITNTGRDSNFGGHTTIAVSRTNPFHGGTGTLTTSDDTVFSSGQFGNLGDDGQLRLYAPARSNMVGLAGNTLLNSQAFDDTAIALGNFVAPPVGIFSQDAPFQRVDEQYLTPSLFWDNLPISLDADTMPFPTNDPLDANYYKTSIGGSIAQVVTPGGWDSLTDLVVGSIRTDDNPDYNGFLSGLLGFGDYTLYFDAVEDVPPAPGTAVLPPVIPPVIPPGGGSPTAPGAPTPPGLPEPFVPLFAEFPEFIPVIDTGLDFLSLLVLDFHSLQADEQRFLEAELEGGPTTGLGTFFDSLFALFLAEEEIYVEGQELLSQGLLPGIRSDTEGEAENTRKREKDDAQYNNLTRARYGTFWAHPVGADGYSSFKVFGVPLEGINIP